MILYLEASYAGMPITGRAYDYGQGIFYGTEKPNINAQSGYGMSFRSWDFERM